MKYHLKTSEGAFPLKVGMNIVGRQKGCDIQIKDPYMSRRHLSIDVISDGTFTLMDLGSSNGLYVNGHKVPHAILQLGDSFALGSMIFNILEN